MSATSIHDVAAAITAIRGRPISTAALQRLTFLADAWSRALRDEPLFSEEFEPGRGRPLSRALLALHLGRFEVDRWDAGDIGNLTAAESEIISSVVRQYSAMTGPQLTEIVQSIAPDSDVLTAANWVREQNGIPRVSPTPVNRV